MQRLTLGTLALSTALAQSPADVLDGTFSVKLRENITSSAHGSFEQELKLSYTAHIGTLFGQSFDLQPSYRIIDGKALRQALQVGVQAQNQLHTGAAFLEEFPTHNKYVVGLLGYDVGSKRLFGRRTSLVNLSADILHDVAKHPGWAKAKVRAEVPLGPYHGIDIGADVRYYPAFSQYETTKVSAGVSLRRSFRHRQ